MVDSVSLTETCRWSTFQVLSEARFRLHQRRFLRQTQQQLPAGVVLEHRRKEPLSPGRHPPGAARGGAQELARSGGGAEVARRGALLRAVSEVIFGEFSAT